MKKSVRATNAMNVAMKFASQERRRPTSLSPVSQYLSRKKPTSRPHCDNKSSQRLATLHFEGDQIPLHPN